jgi:hypothetical protein
MRVSASQPKAISAISVRGFKSLRDQSTIELRPLTLLAGANSSGKSSIMQPALLLKQTLEAPYDPGPLLLSDSHVRFTSAEQMLTRLSARERARDFSVKVEFDDGLIATGSTFRRVEGGHDFELIETSHRLGDLSYALRPGMKSSEIRELVAVLAQRAIGKRRTLGGFDDWEVRRRRCFLESEAVSDFFLLDLSVEILGGIAGVLEGILHVPGLRGNPARTYKTSAVGRNFPGTFENYVASVISSWQDEEDPRLAELGESLSQLGLTSKVRAFPRDATQAEIRVGRLPKSRRGAQDLVNIADVGFGVSQTLPVVVALLTAEPGQLVYLEQPEIHLHPRAQVALADVLLEAAQRGVIVVAETHSALLLLALQTRVAQGRVDPDLIRLNWFRRREDGVTEVTSGQLDEFGAYGDWPEDFGTVILEAESRYLDAAEAALARR